MKLISKHEGTADYAPGPSTSIRSGSTSRRTTAPSSRACAATSWRPARRRKSRSADWDVAFDVLLAERASTASPASTTTAAPSLQRLRREDRRAASRSRTSRRARSPRSGSPAARRSSPSSSTATGAPEQPLRLRVRRARRPVRLTDTLRRKSIRRTSSTRQVVRFRSFDGMAIPNIFYKPHQATAEAKAPALVWVHGGPGGQTRRQYSAGDPVPRQPRVRRARDQQPRAAPATARRFFTADDTEARARAALGLRRREEVPPEPAVRRPRSDRHPRRQLRRLHGARGARVPARCSSRSASTSSASRTGSARSRASRSGGSRSGVALYQEIGDPVKDREMLAAISPLFHAGPDPAAADRPPGRQRPARHQAGVRRHRRRREEERRAGRVRRLPDDEGHGFTKRKNEIDGWNAILKFLDTNLKGASPPAK